MSETNASAALPPTGIIVLCVAIVAVLWAALLFDINRSENSAVKQAGNDAANLAMTFRENVKRTVSAVDQLMLTLIAENNESGDPYRMPPWVKNSPLLGGMSVQVSIAGPNGVMAASSLGSTAHVDISDRPHFRYHLDPSASQPYISVPVIGRNSGKWSIQITRRITLKDGSFGGVIVVSVDPLYFSKFFDSVNVGQNGVIDLIGRDGIVRARRARNSQEIGQNVGDTPLFKWMQDSSAGTEIIRSKLDGLTRVYGYSAVDDYPLVVAVGLSMGDVLAPVYRQRTLYLALGAGLTLVIVTLSWFLARETKRRRERELSALTEEKVGEQRMLLDTALNNMRKGLLMFDGAGRAVVINQSYVEMYGLSPATAKPGCTIRELLEQRTANGTFEGNIESYVANHFVQVEVTDKIFSLPDGRSIRVVNRFMDNGGWVSVHEDVTERMRVEEDRDRNRAFLDRIIDNISVAIQVKNAHTLRYMLVNKASEELWGLPREQIIGKTPHEIFDKDFADVIEEHDRQLLDMRTNFYVPEHKIETPRNGTRMVTSNRIAIRDNNGEVQYLVGVVEDVTERKSVEDQLRQAQKMEAVGNLTGGIAHDFNNLLTVIIGNLDFLQEDVAGNAAAEEKIKVILDAAERGADLTQHMLAFSRRQPLQAKPVDINALIETTTRLLGRTLGENISVDVQTTSNLPLALVDPSQLETAVLNIAINARDAMPNGGVLTIRTRVAELDEMYTRQHPGVSPGVYAAIELGDSGTGMPPELLERIFEPFFTTKAAGKGTGLGLSMVYGFIKQSGGHISAYSEVGRGTVFKLYLPLAEPAAVELVRESAAPRAAKPAGSEVILAVEDNPDIRATVVRHLRDLGYRVREADSADAALQILDAAEPIDLLFTDMIMPGELNGKELADKARTKRSDLRVLFTSGFLGPSNGHGAQLEAGDVLLSKPYHKRDLAKAVEQVLSMPA